MTDQDPPTPEPEQPSGGRNQWDFEAPDPALSFHGDLPTDPNALEDRPTGAAAPLPGSVAGAAASTSPDALPADAQPAGLASPATQPAGAAHPLGAGVPVGASATKRVGMRTAAILIGIAALVGLGIVTGLVFTGGDDSEIIATDTTPGPERTAEPTPGPTAEPTPEPTPTAEPTPTPEPLVAATDLQATTASFGGDVAERWDLRDGRLTSTIEISNDTDADLDGLHVVIVPTSVAAAVDRITFDPEPTDIVEADDPAAAFMVAVDPGDPPVTITWSADVELAAGETPEAALERLLADRAAAAFRFAADAPGLVINAPDDGSTTIGSSVTLRGQTDADATVTVARDIVAVNADNGRFRSEIERTRDRREIVIVASDPYGRTTELTWTVRFADPAPTPTPRPVVVPPTRPVEPPPPTPRPTPTPPPQCLPGQSGCR